MKQQPPIAPDSVRDQLAGIFDDWLVLARRVEDPNDGSMVPLDFGDLEEEGWTFIVDIVHDTRFYAKPVVCAYAFAPEQSFASLKMYDEVRRGKADKLYLKKQRIKKLRKLRDSYLREIKRLDKQIARLSK